MLYETLELLNDIVNAGGTIAEYQDEINREIVEFTGELLGIELSEDDGFLVDEGFFRVDTTGVSLYLEDGDEPEDVIEDILDRLERKNDEIDLIAHQLRVLKDDLEALYFELNHNGF